MIKPEELPGRLVLVQRPPSSKVGSICSALLENHHVTVKFSHEPAASFSVRELFVLRKVDEIELDALNDQALLPYENFQDIMEVARLANSPQLAAQIVGMEISGKDPDVFEYTMVSLAEELGLKRSYSVSR